MFPFLLVWKALPYTILPCLFINFIVLQWYINSWKVQIQRGYHIILYLVLDSLDRIIICIYRYIIIWSNRSNRETNITVIFISIWSIAPSLPENSSTLFIEFSELNPFIISEISSSVKYLFCENTLSFFRYSSYILLSKVQRKLAKGNNII